MRKKNTFLSIVLLSASTMMIHAQGESKEMRWLNSSNSGIWDLLNTEWEDNSLGFPLPAAWEAGSVAVFDGGGKFTDAEGNPKEEESIKLNGEMVTAGIKVSGEKNYSVSFMADKAADKIVGTGSLIKEGTGTFSLNVLNMLTGGTIVRGGSVEMENTDSPNVFGDKITLENGSVGFAPATNKNSFAVATPIFIPEGKTGGIYAGRYAQLNGDITGKGKLTIYTGGERVYITPDKSGSKDMAIFNNFEGELVIDANLATASGKPAYLGVQFTTTKNFDGVTEMTGIDSTFINKKITLAGSAGLSSASGVKCYAIGELNVEGEGFLSGYGSGGSTSPVAWWSIGYSNTDVTLPLWLRDNQNGGKNKFGVIKEGTGTYILTGKNNAASGRVFQGLHIKNGKAYINTPLDDNSISALYGRGVAMAIYKNAIGGGNGRISGEVVVDGGKLEIGLNGIGALILADTLSGTMKSPLTVKNEGVVEFELSSATSYDKLTTNNAATFGGNKMIVKLASTYNIKDGDEFTILDAKNKPADDTYVVEFANLPTGITLSYKEESYESGKKVDEETQVETPVMGYRIIVKAAGSGSGSSGIESTTTNNEVVISTQDGQIVVNGAEVKRVTVLNNQGQVVATSNTEVVAMNAMKGLYIVKVDTANGVVVKKVIL